MLLQHKIRVGTMKSSNKFYGRTSAKYDGKNSFYSWTGVAASIGTFNPNAKLTLWEYILFCRN